MQFFPVNRRQKTAAALPWGIFFFGLVFLAVYFLMDGLKFPIRKDELHFWPTALQFSHSILPTLHTLGNYNELSTPLPFWLAGVTELVFHRGIFAARLINFFLGFACLWLVYFAKADGSPGRQQLVASLGLFAFPYFLAVSTHFYTDILPLCFVLLGTQSAVRGAMAASSVFFTLAIAGRQYAVVFPFCFFVLGLIERDWKRCWFSGVAALSLLGWFVLWGGPAPQIALQSQPVSTSSLMGLLPQNAAYFLAVLGVYYVVPEALVFGRKSWENSRSSHPSRSIGLVFLLALFVFFPPLGNPENYPFKEMGYFDKALRAVLNDSARVVVLWAFALLTLLRFWSFSFEALLVLAHAVLMCKAHIAWDKYALLPLGVLWWLKAYDGKFPTRDLCQRPWFFPARKTR